MQFVPKCGNIFWWNLQKEEWSRTFTRSAEMHPPLDMTASLFGREEWHRVGNAHEFAAALYGYFRRRGWMRIVAQEMSRLVKLGCTVLVTLVLTRYTDWRAAWRCDAASCNVFHGHAASAVSRTLDGTLLAVALLALLSTRATLVKMYHARAVYADLDISDADLRTVSWETVASRLVQANEYRQYSAQLSSRDSIRRLLTRNDDIFCGMVRDGLVPITRVTNMLLWVLRDGMLQVYLTGKNQRQRVRQRDVDRLCTGLAVAMVCACPVVLLFSATYLIVHHAGDVRAGVAATLTGRSLSCGTRCQIRRTRELPHELELRISSAWPYAQKLLKQTGNPLVNSTCRSVHFIANSVMFVLLLVTAFNEELLIHGRVAGVTLLWMLAASTATSVCTRSEEEAPVREEVLLADKRALLLHIGTGDATGQTTDVLESLRHMYRLDVLNTVRELSSCITVPCLLLNCVLLSKTSAVSAYMNACDTDTDTDTPGRTTEAEHDATVKRVAGFADLHVAVPARQEMDMNIDDDLVAAYMEAF